MKQLRHMTPELVAQLYSVIGIAVPQDRALNQIVIVLEPNKPVTVTERHYPIVDVPDPPAPSPADAAGTA